MVPVTRWQAAVMPMFLAAATLIAAQPAAGNDASATDVEQRFDRSGDGVVDAEDWQHLSSQERRDYVRALLGAFSPPNTPENQHRTELYLNAITRLYHYR